MESTDKNKIPFVIKTKAEIKDLSEIDALQYDVDLKKWEYDQARIKFREIRQVAGKTRKSDETRRYILWGKMVEAHVKDNPDRRVSYLQLQDWMDQFLTKESDRTLCGFPLKSNDN